MNKILIPLLYLFISTSLLLSASQRDNAIITGTIRNLQQSEITVNNHPVDVNPDGRFQHILQLQGPAYVEINYGKTIVIYLKPGDSLNLKIHAEEEINAIGLKGDRVDINHHLLRETYKSTEISQYFNQNFTDIVTLKEDKFVKKMDALWQPFEERFESFITEHNITDAYFIKTQRAVLLYSKTTILLRYPKWHSHFTGNPEYLPPDKFYDFMDRLNVNDSELLEINEYKAFLDMVLHWQTEEKLKTIEFDGMNYKPFRAKMQVCLDTFTDPDIRSEMIYSVMQELLSEYYHKGIYDLIETFRQNCTNQSYRNEIDRMIKADQQMRDECEIRTYKEIDGITLDAFLYTPPDLKKGERRPAIAFFHGGGWECGKPEWGDWQCRHFSSLGLVALSFEYRLETQHGATPVESVSDARSAIRWMRKHAEELHIDPDRIVGSGFSAGGHIALCTVMINQFDDSNDDLSIHPGVNAFLLWVTPAKIYDGMKARLKSKAAVNDIDPASHIRPDLPPMVFFQGTVDNQVPPESVIDFVEKMKAAGNRCELHLYEGQTHLGWGDNGLDVLKKMDVFLESLGYLEFGEDN